MSDQWKTKDGRVIKFADMTTFHLENAIRCMRRQIMDAAAMQTMSDFKIDLVIRNANAIRTMQCILHERSVPQIPLPLKVPPTISPNSPDACSRVNFNDICIQKPLLSRHPEHYIRKAAVAILNSEGKTQEECLQYFESLKWENWNKDITRMHIADNFQWMCPPSCGEMKFRGLCLNKECPKNVSPDQPKTFKERLTQKMQEFKDRLTSHSVPDRYY